MNITYSTTWISLLHYISTYGTSEWWSIFMNFLIPHLNNYWATKASGCCPSHDQDVYNTPILCTQTVLKMIMNDIVANQHHTHDRSARCMTVTAIESKLCPVFSIHMGRINSKHILKHTHTCIRATALFEGDGAC